MGWLKELKEIQKELFEMCLYLGPDTENPENDPFTWFCVLKGPTDSPYEGGVFRLKITIPEDYPQVAPKVEFLTTVYHPNISGGGEICLDILNEPQLWSEQLTIQKVMISVLSLMTDANPEDPLCPDVAGLYMRDRKKFNSVATEWTFTYAK